MKTSITPRAEAGVHTGTNTAYGGSTRKRRAFGGGEAVIWDRLFPQGRGRWQTVGVAVLLAILLGAAILTVFGALRGRSGGAGDDGRLPGGVAATGTQEEATGGEESSETATREPEGEDETPEAGTAPQETVDTPDTPDVPDASDTVDTTDTAVDAETVDGTETPGGGDSDGVTDEVPTETADPDTAGGEGETPDEPPTEAESETERIVPEGCYAIQSVDMSMSECGVGYVVGETDGLPAVLPRDELWTGEGMPTVLLIHTHPYEGYGDGKAWYDPASGGMAVTDSAYASDGVVALGAALARGLREAGATVIHLRVAVAEEDSAADVYARTEAAVRSYCALYPDIGLVIDLRRSAEMTEDGGILRTAGELGGEACAQLRISVSGGRSEAALGRDLAAALALRERLWSMSPALSRPVRVKAGGGPAGIPDGVCFLTMELGAAGNIFSEAARLTEPLAAAIGMLLGATVQG